MDEDAAVLTCYVRERQRVGARFPGGDLIDLYERRATAASVLLRSIEGYGPGPPLAAVAVDTGPRIDALLDEVAGLAQPRLITLERARLLSGEIDPLWLGDSATEAARLTIYCGHADSVYLVPAFQAACESAKVCGVSGTSNARVLFGSR